MDLTIVVSYGRSGSTIFMRMLSQNPAFLIRRLFPYEGRTSQYLFAASKVGLPANLDPVTYQEATYEFAQYGDDEVLEFGRRLNEGASYDPLALSKVMLDYAASIERNTDAMYAVEKGIGVDLARDIVSEIPTARIIFLIRDPRSIYYSVKSFNRKRNIITFGEEAGEEELFRRIVKSLHYMNQLSMAIGERSTVLRYEEMMENTDLFCRRVLSFFSLSDENETVNRMTSVVDLYDQSAKDHMTSSPRADVLRWKNDIKQSDLSIFSKWEGDLREIGYD